MFNIKTLNKIANIGLEKFDKNFFACGEDFENEDAILVRSASLHEYEMGENLKAIARCGAGYNNIPTDECAEKGIVVFNTPGANANAVKELVILGLLISSRKVPKALDWAKTLEGSDVPKQVEKGKSNFGGPEIKGKTLGVAGLGAIGRLVALAAFDLGMSVIGYDPYLSDCAKKEVEGKVTIVSSLDDIYKNSDYITLHIPQTDETKNTVNKNTIATMKDGVRILNFARGGLVSDDDIKVALESGKVTAYITDFPNEKTIKMEGVIALPHLGASTPESEDNCAIMAADQVSEFLLNGNIINSVNLPNLNEERKADHRICIISCNCDDSLAKINDTARDSVSSKTEIKGDFAYSIFDVNAICENTVNSLKEINGVKKVYTI